MSLKSRIHPLKVTRTRGKCVLYIMSRDQRVEYNHALLSAQKHALAKNLPLAVVFCFYTRARNSAREHYDFMLGGLREVEAQLSSLSIAFLPVIGNPYDKLSATFHHLEPDAVYFDFNPLRGPSKLQMKLADTHDVSMYQVDTHNVVPARAVSQKQEVGAYAIRPKIHRLISDYLSEPEHIIPHPTTWPGEVKGLDALMPLINEQLSKLPSNGTKSSFLPGTSEARLVLNRFVNSGLESYALDRNDPTKNAQSGLSAYLHFGQISALEICLTLRKKLLSDGRDVHILSSSKMPKRETSADAEAYGADCFLEELIIRKELADNFCFWNGDYDSLFGAPQWAVSSLEKHRLDAREHVYDDVQLERGKTHDDAWNSAQLELNNTAKMHGYMRMYWAKKVLEWSPSPEDAVRRLIYLNDFYSLDGRDPNGYAGILWSVGGVHDRPWAEREIFGMIRYMNYEGLKRKFDVTDYEKLERKFAI